MNEKIAAAKNFVRKHQVALACTATAVVTTTLAVYLQKSAIEQRDEFLKEHNLLETYYAKLAEEI